jgi:putative tricarboxylic transport membrane protein
MANYIASFCFFVLAGIYLYATFLLPTMRSQDPMGPKVFPVLLGIALAAGAVLLLAETIRGTGKEKKKAKEPREGTQKNPGLIWAVIAWTIVFFLLFEPLGYIVSSILYILPLMVCFNKKRWWTNGITSMLFPLGIYILFVKFLGIMLPKGVIPW